MADDPKTTHPTIDPRGSHDSLRLRAPAELSAGLRALRDHLRTLDSASPEAALMNEAALYLDGATDSLREHMAMVRQARAALLRLIQRGNDCAATGKSCREDRRCGCYLEMQEQAHA